MKATPDVCGARGAPEPEGILAPNVLMCSLASACRQLAQTLARGEKVAADLPGAIPMGSDGVLRRTESPGLPVHTPDGVAKVSFATQFRALFGVAYTRRQSRPAERANLYAGSSSIHESAKYYSMVRIQVLGRKR